MDNTREKLIDLLGGDMCQGCYCEDCEHENNEKSCIEAIKRKMADHLIANGVTLDNQVSSSKWIPVSERLPEVAATHNTRWDKSTDSIRVLCACVQADGKKMVKEGYCKVYTDGYVHWKIPGTIHSVTHWMPLPEPPKGE